MKRNRIIWFGVSILLGFLVGALYGWFINPPKSGETTMDSMRSDFKTDYVLMVAQVYSVDKDAIIAKSRLVVLGGDSNLVVQQALTNAHSLNYSVSDIALLTALAQGLQGQPITTAQPSLTPTQKGKLK